MSRSFAEEKDVSKRELDDYKDRYYSQLKDEKYKVKVSHKFFQCPFCPAKRELEYLYDELLHHASGVARGSHRRAVKEKAKHLALVKYMERYLSSKRPSQSTPKSVPGPPSGPDAKERYVWPWLGVIANIPVEFKDGRYVGESGTKLREEFERQGFNPHKVNPLWNYRGHSGFAIVEFDRDWHGFSNAMMFEKAFQAKHCGKKDYKSAKHLGNTLYGWVARDDDYYGKGIVGDNLRKMGDVKTVNEVEAEDKRKTTRLVSNLENTLEDKNKRIKEIESKYNETSTSLNRLMAQRDQIQLAHNEEVSKMQQKEHNYFEKVLTEHQMIRVQLEAQREILLKREKELADREANNLSASQKLVHEKRMNEQATLEQNKADEELLRLAEDQEREKKKLHRKILELEKQLDEKQALELEIERLKGSLEVVRHMGEDGDMEMKEKMEKMQEELDEKQEDLEGIEDMKQALIIKEKKTNDELQDGRKELIAAFKDLSSRALIGVKRMGELDSKPFHDAMKIKYSSEEADEKALELCSLWEYCLRDLNWHPFKTEETGEKIDEDDDKLKGLKSEHGEEVFNAVATALAEMNECSPNDRNTVPVLWNFKEGRKAVLKEGVAFLLKQWKLHKRRKN